MEAFIQTVKNVGYIIIIFALFDKTMLINKENEIIRYIAGLIVVITIVTPVIKNLSGADGDVIIEQIDELISFNEETPYDEIIKMNDEKAREYINNQLTDE